MKLSRIWRILQIEEGGQWHHHAYVSFREQFPQKIMYKPFWKYLSALHCLVTAAPLENHMISKNILNLQKKIIKRSIY